ncbi:MAG: hypothetical protein RL033_3071 [Pseudomonadota bacterium]
MGARPEAGKGNVDLVFTGAVEFAVPVASPGAPALTSPATPGATRARQERPAPGPTPGPAPRILCVDDEPAMLKVLTRALEADFEIITANDPRKALVLLEHGMDFTVVISDMRMPQMDGAEFLAHVARLSPNSTRLALTACLERELAPDEVFGILTKPCPINLLHASVQAAVDHHAMQARLRRSGSQPVPPAVMTGIALPGAAAHAAVPLSRPRREAQLPELRASLQDPDPTLVLPHLAFDPWSANLERDAPDSEAPRLSMLAGVAEKFFRLGHGHEAERILRPALWDILRRCETERRVADREVELAAQLALRLTGDTRSAQWIDYVFRLFTAMSRPLPTDLIELLHELIRLVPGTSRVGFQRYLSALRASRHEFGPGEHFLIRRIEGLEPLISP